MVSVKLDGLVLPGLWGCE